VETQQAVLWISRRSNPKATTAALKEIEGLMNARRNTPVGDRLDVLVALAEAWETERGYDPAIA
jgi:hypothetical protein